MDIIDHRCCRICKHVFEHSETTPVLDLGDMPLANAYISAKDLGKSEARYPLGIRFCRNCSLVQLSHIVNPGILFKDYAYMTSASKPLIDHFKGFAEEIFQKHIKAHNDLVVEIGSNDGTLLKNFAGIYRVIGVEPAETLARYTKDEGITTYVDLFTSTLAKQIRETHGQAQVVVANNVLAHIHDLDDVFEGISLLLADSGVLVFEVHWVGNLVGDGGFDQIYHEHLSYFSLRSLVMGAMWWGFGLIDAELVPTHGQSLRVTMARSGSLSSRAKELLNKEMELGLWRMSTYEVFAKRVYALQKEIYQMIKKIRIMGKRVVGYGASAKGNILLNFCGLDATLIDYIIDTTPLKQGKYTPGIHIPIHSPETLHSDTPDYILLLAWNYANAIMRKEEWFSRQGGKFIIPVPEVKII